MNDNWNFKIIFNYSYENSLSLWRVINLNTKR